MAETIWQNSCITCGKVIETHGAEPPGPCPECNGWRFLCHLQNPVDKVDKPEGGQENTQPTIKLPLKSPRKQGMTVKVGAGDNDAIGTFVPVEHADFSDFGNLAENAKLPARDGDKDFMDFRHLAENHKKGNGHRGRPQTTIPETLFKSLVDKAICRTLRLEYIILTLTERCNFACAHCYGDCGPKGEDMALSNALNCIELAARRNVNAVIFTGGEPTLYPGLLDCLERAASLGLYTALATNGSFKGERLEDFKRAGLRELHISYDKFHSPYISTDRVKQVIDSAVVLGIRPVLVIIEANSYSKYAVLFGDYLQFCQSGHTFKPLVNAGRAVHLPKSEFESDTLLPIGKTHQFNIYVSPQAQVSFCPVNHSFASTVVDLASDWLDGVVEMFSQDPMVKIVVNEGVSGIWCRYTGIASDDWCSPFYECNLCIQATRELHNND